MKKLYLVRQILLSDDSGSVIIDEETLFDTKDEALDFINDLSEENVSELDMKIFRNTMTEIPVNLRDNWESKVEKIYSLDGRLLDTFSSSGTPFNINLSFNHKYNVGDVVKVKCKLENSSSFSVKGTYAVISEISNNNNNDDEDYIIYYISSLGFMTHAHVREQILDNLSKLPDEYNFLNVLSKYFIDDNVEDKVNINRALQGEMYVKNIPCFFSLKSNIKNID